MTPLQFEADYAPMWAELETALTHVEGGRKRFSVSLRKRPAQTGDAPDAARLARLYRAACEQLALARARAYPAHLTNRLESLTQRAHRLIYRRTDYGAARFAQLFLLDFPQAVRAHWRYVLVAGLVFGVPLLLLGLATYLDPGFILTLHDAQAVRGYEDMYGPAAASIGRERGADTDWMMFGFYIRHNISIAFRCFAGGIMLGLGSLYALAYNGAIIGSLAGYLTARGHAETFYSFVVTHGAFELSAAVLAGAAGLRLGHALLAPGRRTRRAALELAARESAVLVYGVVAMLLIAAGLEAFWSSARWVVPAVKFAAGGLCWTLVIAYFVGQGRAARLPSAAGRGTP